MSIQASVQLREMFKLGYFFRLNGYETCILLTKTHVMMPNSIADVLAMCKDA